MWSNYSLRRDEGKFYKCWVNSGLGKIKSQATVLWNVKCNNITQQAGEDLIQKNKILAVQNHTGYL